MEPDADMESCDEYGLPSVDDLTVVAEIAEAELRQLEKIQAAGNAGEVRRRLESQQRNEGTAKGADSTDAQDGGVPGVSKVRRVSSTPHSVVGCRRKRSQRNAGQAYAATVVRNYSIHVLLYMSSLLGKFAAVLASVRLNSNITETGWAVLACVSQETPRCTHTASQSTVCICFIFRTVQEGDDNGGTAVEGSSGDDSGDESGQHGDSAPESDSGDTIMNLEATLKLMEAKRAEPDVPPSGPLHGLELPELPAEQLEIQIKDTDKLTHIGRVTSVVDGIIVVKVCPLSLGFAICLVAGRRLLRCWLLWDFTTNIPIPRVRPGEVDTQTYSLCPEVAGVRSCAECSKSPTISQGENCAGSRKQPANGHRHRVLC